MDSRIESRKVQFEPCQSAVGLNITVKVENYDGSWSTAPISPVSFDRVAPQLKCLLVQVSETIDGESHLHEEVQRHFDVVTQMEQKYIFFADEADVARKMVRRGRSCVLSVYFREA
jgi:hypothetical protein